MTQNFKHAGGDRRDQALYFNEKIELWPIILAKDDRQSVDEADWIERCDRLTRNVDYICDPRL